MSVARSLVEGKATDQRRGSKRSTRADDLRAHSRSDPLAIGQFLSTRFFLAFMAMA